MKMQRLTERVAVSVEENSAIALPLNESTKMTETKDGKSYSSHGAYTVEISRYNYLNRNGRVYSKGLWENVISNQKNIYEGSAGLMNHPKEEASVKDIFCVWHNMRLREDTQTVIADMYLVGENGKTAKEFLEAGGKLELSSSGFGNILEDGKTVEESTYQIERPADWVFDASAEVFATSEDVISENIKKVVSEKISATNNKEEEKKLMESAGMTKKQMLKQSESYIHSKLKEVSKTESLVEKKSIYSDIIDYIDGDENFSETQKMIEKELAEIENQFSKLEEKVKKVSEKKDGISEEDYKALAEKYEKAQELLDIFRKELKEERKIRERTTTLYEEAVAEKNGMIPADDYIEAVKKEKQIKQEKSMRRISNRKRTSPVRKRSVEQREFASSRRKPIRKRSNSKQRASSITEERRERIKKVLEKKRRAEKLKDRRTVERKPVSKRLGISEHRGASIGRPISRKRPVRESLERKRPVKRISERKKPESQVDILQEKQENLLKATQMNSIVNKETREVILDWYKDMLKENSSIKKIEDFILASPSLQEAKSRVYQMTDLSVDMSNGSEKNSPAGFIQEKAKEYSAGVTQSEEKDALSYLSESLGDGWI